MDSTTSILAVIFGLLLRIGLPVGITFFLVQWLRKLDFRWQKESDQEMKAVGAIVPSNCGCWEKRGCTPECQKTCKAYTHPEAPCWQVFREETGWLKESCLTCSVFLNASVPVAAGD